MFLHASEKLNAFSCTNRSSHIFFQVAKSVMDFDLKYLECLRYQGMLKDFTLSVGILWKDTKRTPESEYSNDNVVRLQK